MSNWRRQKPRNKNNNIKNHHQQWTPITQSSNPSLASCKLSVPTWEKEFCAVVGAVPWKKVLEAKRFMYLYDRVVQWDDSAGEEAFKNAKSRFWAEINGFPYDLSLPDQDAYIDDVDWDAEVDTELILDLERGPDPMPEEHVVILDALVVSEQYSGQGWGTGWGDAEGINEETVGKPENSWEDQKCDAWNDDSWGIKEKPESWDRKNNNNSFKTESWDHKKNNKNSFKTESWDHKKKSNYTNCVSYKKVHNCSGRDQGRESREWRKREVSRGGDPVEDCGWKNGKGRSRGGFQQQSNGWGWTETF